MAPPREETGRERGASLTTQIASALTVDGTSPAQQHAKTPGHVHPIVHSVTMPYTMYPLMQKP